MKKYLTEAHAHVRPESACSEIQPEELGKIYAARNFDTVVLTNHFDKYSSPDGYLECFYKTKKAAEEYNVGIILGMEIRFPHENANDYLVYGIDDDDVYRAFELTGGTYNEFYTAFKNERNVIVQAHPFRPNIVLADLNYLDGIEVFNLHPRQPSVSGLGARLLSEHNDFIATGGSDFHHPGTEALIATVTDRRVEDSIEFAKVLKSGKYTFKIGDFEVKRKK